MISPSDSDKLQQAALKQGFDPNSAQATEIAESITKACADVLNLQLLIESLEDEIATAKKEIKRLSRHVIPEYLEQTGSTTWSNQAMKVEVIEKYVGQFPKTVDKIDVACEEIKRFKGGEEILTVELSCKYKRGQLSQALEAAKNIERPGLMPFVGYSVHPQTLAKFARDRSDTDLDLDKIGVYHFSTAIVKKK